MKKISLLLLSVLLAQLSILNAVAASPPIIVIPLSCEDSNSCAVYVDAAYNTPLPSDGSKEQPFKRITDAVEKVKNEQDFGVIVIAGGTYNQEVLPWQFDDTLGKTVKIYGGYSGYQNDFAVPTGLSLVNPTYVATGGDAAISFEDMSAVVDGLHFNGGNVAGSGVAVISAINIVDGGFDVEIKNSSFYNYSGFDNVVAVAMYGSNAATFSWNRVYDNTVSGAAISVIGDVSVEKNRLDGNTSDKTFLCNEASFENNYVFDNVADMVVDVNGDCEVYHNTIAYNKGATDIVDMAGNTNDVRNNLIVSNIGSGDTFMHEGGDLSAFDGNALWNNSGDPTTFSGQNVSCDPLFEGMTIEGMKLGTESECIDAGVAGSGVGDDYFGSERPLDGDGDDVLTPDPGAHEAPTVVVTPDDPTPNPPSGIEPEITSLGVTMDPFSPDEDGIKDSTTVSFSLNLPASIVADVTVEVLTSGDILVKKLADAESKSAGSLSYVWDGKDTGGNVMPNGTYTIRVHAINSGGEVEATTTVLIDIPGEIPADGFCAGFSDLPYDYEGCDAVEYVKSIGAMTGNDDGTFAPKNFLQRDQIAKISLETFELYDGSADYCQGEDPFPDVPVAQWSYQYICRGVALQMITGYLSGEDAGMYRPGRSVNRAEFLALILRNLDDNVPTEGTVDAYADVEADSWYSGYAQYSYDNELFAGTNLDPGAFTSRIEVAEVLYKLHTLGKI